MLSSLLCIRLSAGSLSTSSSPPRFASLARISIFAFRVGFHVEPMISLAFGHLSPFRPTYHLHLSVLSTLNQLRLVFLPLTDIASTISVRTQRSVTPLPPPYDVSRATHPCSILHACIATSPMPVTLHLCPPPDPYPNTLALPLPVHTGMPKGTWPRSPHARAQLINCIGMDTPAQSSSLAPRDPCPTIWGTDTWFGRTQSWLTQPGSHPMPRDSIPSHAVAPNWESSSS